MRLFVALFWLLSLLGLQAHGFVPHEHHDVHATTHYHDLQVVEFTSAVFAGSDIVQLSEVPHRHQLHTHSDAIEAKPPRSWRGDVDFAAVLPRSFTVVLPLALGQPARCSHPFIPFPTGPPRTTSSRGPPLPVV